MCRILLHINIKLLALITNTRAIFIAIIFFQIPGAHRGGIKAYHQKISFFKTFLKQHLPRTIAPVVSGGNIVLSALVETYFEDKLLSTWADYTHKVLHVTTKCAFDGYSDGPEGNTSIPTVEALIDARCISSIIQRMYRRSALVGTSVER